MPAAMLPFPQRCGAGLALGAGLVTALVIATLAPPAVALQVSSLRARHHHGQTFLTWRNLPGTGWTYRVYESESPITMVSSPAVRWLGNVQDSSSMDRRMTMLLGTLTTFRPDSAAALTSIGDGLFVNTVPVSRNCWYAVTAQASGQSEDRTVFAGLNALPSPVNEVPSRPRPVWQRTLTSPAGEDYVLWGSPTPTTYVLPLAATPSRPFHVGIRRGTPGGPLTLSGHGRGGNFLHSLVTIGLPGESVISVDDWVSSGDYATWYFGYHPDYDVDAPSRSVPNEGRIEDYTDRRVMALLDWAEVELGHDRNRVYATGASMGGTFAMMLAWHHADRIAAATAGVPMTTFSYLPDAAPQMRPSMERMWGPLEARLEGPAEGVAAYDWIDGRWLAREFERRGSAPIVAFHGRHDDIIGWPATVSYLAAAGAHRAGGYYYWDESDHMTWMEGAWKPMRQASFLGRFRLDQSFPAFSNCTADDDLGNGTLTTGTAVGQKNAFVDFAPDIVDTPALWSVQLFARDLTTKDGPRTAPEVLSVDVTPRRLQSFRPAYGLPVTWTVTRSSDGTVLQSGTASPDLAGVLTIPAVTVYRSGVELRMTLPAAGSPGVPAVGARLVLSLSSNPVRGSARVRLSGTGPGRVHIDLVDVVGRRVRDLFDGSLDAGREVTLRTDGLAPGLYWLRAAQGDGRATTRVVVVH